MAIRQVRALPERRMPTARKGSYVAHDVREFLRQGMEVAEVTHEGRKAANVGAALANYIKKHQDTCAGIGACVRGGVAYLYRKEGKR